MQQTYFVSSKVSGLDNIGLDGSVGFAGLELADDDDGAAAGADCDLAAGPSRMDRSLPSSRPSFCLSRSQTNKSPSEKQNSDKDFILPNVLDWHRMDSMYPSRVWTCS